MKLREAPLRMTNLIFIYHLHRIHMSIQPRIAAQPREADWYSDKNADPSPAPLAMKLREAPLRMTNLIFIYHLHRSYMSIQPRIAAQPREADWYSDKNAGPSTAPLAMKLRGSAQDDKPYIYLSLA
jgi:hypothetical protein